MSSQPFPDARRASLSTLLFACAAAFTGLLLFRVHSAPAEDAAMLMRYVDHLARGRGIVWNVGDSPVDGASDFVPLLLAAGLSRAGLGAEAAARLLASGAHVLTAFVMLAAGRFRWTALLIALIVLFGPGWLYANAGFVTPVFGLLTALLVFASERRGLSGWFFAIAPLLAMTRPEGTPLVFMVGVAAMWFWRRDLRPGPLASFLAILIAYVLWRRWYFGTWIPSPYFAKGGFYLQGDGILASMNYASRFLWFAVAPLWIAFFKHDHKRTVFGILTPVAAFTVLWMLLSNQTNFGGRFQYAVLPMTAAWLAAAHSKWWPDSRGLREACAAILAAAAAANLVQYRPIPLEDGRRDVGQALARFPGPRTMVVTEAGLVPFYSNWRAVDALD